MAYFRKYAKYRPRRYRKKVAGKKLVKKAVSRVRNAAFRKKVLSVIHKENETKQAAVSTTLIQFNSSIAATGDIMRIVPQINKGTSDNSRIGDQIRGQKLVLDGILNFPPILNSNVNTPGRCAIGVRMMIVTPKTYPNWSVASASTAWLSNLLKKGGTTTGFTGDPIDLYAPVNTDAITCHWNKVYYMNQSFVQHNGSTTDVAIPLQGTIRHVKKVIHLRNSLFKYDDSVDSGLTPTNKGYFLLIGYAYTDGTSSPDVLNTRVTFQYFSTLDYEDA